MNVKELKEKLNELPDDMRLVVYGYEDGYDDMVELKQIDLFIGVCDTWYCGEHIECNEYKTLEGKPQERALYLRGKSREERGL